MPSAVHRSAFGLMPINLRAQGSIAVREREIAELRLHFLGRKLEAGGGCVVESVASWNHSLPGIRKNRSDC